MQNLANITTVILAGGLGTRLRSVVADRPKVLAEIRHRPFLSYLLDQVADAGVKDVVLCTGYLGEQIQAYFGETYKKLHLIYSQESSPLGTGGALRLAMPFVKSDPVFVLNGDSFCEVNLQAFYEWYREQYAEIALVLTEVSNTKRYGCVNIDDDGHVLSFEEKGAKNGPGWINAGIYLMSQHRLLTIPENVAVSLEREIFPAWIQRHFYGYKTKGRFLDIGTPESYAVAEQFFQTGGQDNIIAFHCGGSGCGGNKATEFKL